MSCQAQCLIETCVCFLDIFLVLEFPLLSVYFFLQTSMIAVLSHTYKKTPHIWVILSVVLVGYNQYANSQFSQN